MSKINGSKNEAESYIVFEAEQSPTTFRKDSIEFLSTEVKY